MSNEKAKESLSKLLCSGLEVLQEYGGRCITAVAKKDGAPIAAVIVVAGATEAQEMLDAVNEVREQWRAEQEEEDEE